MARGFTLLETLITVIVLLILLVAVAPTYTSISNSYEMKKSAEGLLGFFNQARTETVLRKQDLWVHYHQHINGTESGWRVTLHEDDITRTYTSALSGAIASFSGDKQAVTSTGLKRKFERVNGLPTTGGNVTFWIPGQSEKLKLKYANVTGRMIVCGIGQEAYGYEEC